MTRKIVAHFTDAHLGQKLVMGGTRAGDKMRYDDEPEEQSHGRQHPGRESSERLLEPSFGEQQHDNVDEGGDEERGGEDHDCEPAERKVVKPEGDARRDRR